MSPKLIFLFLLFAILSIYMAFLNPHEVVVHFTQTLSVNLPVVIFLLSSLLLGVMITVLLYWTGKVKTSFQGFRISFKGKQLEKQRKRWEILYEKAENAMSGGECDQAAQLFEKILAEHPNHIHSLLRLGDIRRNGGDLDRALELHQRAVDRAPENIQALFSLAEDYAAAKQYENQRNTLEKIRQINRNALKPLRMIRDSYLATEDWAQLAAVQKKILPLLKDKTEIAAERKRLGQFLCSHGMRLRQQGHRDKAISEIKQALREDDRCVPAYMALGEIHLDAGNPRAALKTWKNGFQSTRSPVCLLRMKKFFQDSDNLKEMVRVYQEAIKTSENSQKENLVMLLASLYLEKDRFEEAISTLEGIQPKQSLLHSVLLGYACQASNQADLAQKVLRSAFDKARNAVQQLTCSACGTQTPEWSETCPACKAWDSLILGWSCRKNGKSA